ncbi:guanine nucleotide-binding protein subunit gamma [Basidiobolus meristosporus CBS 931.73]|uniref:Guanine nucleotide-binding protein subunit gamma n=1 Tax=Basidiobolus meristosporus CBS 931.73 TaxID=1314790 RepID=A0A1Y1YM15_9FUNG|nr:guanine nucleotide-binding protein subunit gamma [Basidiobolus meristosporus CBS 931.73]|eukprot:ORX99059.1 guanine nucleotide-binding protein subunit gamma [Basidiobolus meristosporus CBS 931.73]
MTEIKLKKILENNTRLREQLNVPRATVSEASMSLVKFTKCTRDPMLPSVWGPTEKRDDPYAPSTSNNCVCSVM